jgi:hypothetical protein
LHRSVLVVSHRGWWRHSHFKRQLAVLDDGGIMDFLFFFLVVYMLIACLGDAITTSIGLGRGNVEVNKIAAWLMGKMGLALSSFVVVAVLLACMAVLPLKYDWYSASVISVLETVMTVRNSLLLKKQGLSILEQFKQIF